MQTASSRFWTLVVDSISCDDNIANVQKTLLLTGTNQVCPTINLWLGERIYGFVPFLKGILYEMRRKQPRPGFEPGSPNLFPTVIIVTLPSRFSKSHNLLCSISPLKHRGKNEEKYN